MEIDKVALIYVKDKKLLMALSKGKRLFYIIGGKREKGENDAETLVREIKEELCVDIIPETIQYYDVFRSLADSHPQGTTVKISCYTARFTGTPKPAAEIERIVWVTSKDAGHLTPAGKMIIGDLKKKGIID